MSKYSIFYEKIKTIFQNRSGMIYILFLLMMILVIINKKNLHVDEILTYGLANYSSGWITPSEGKIYSPSESVFLEYTTVRKDSKFDYGNVWQNQLGDTHPPLYYMLVHTICSLFPDKFSIWYAGVVNIVFALLTLYAVRGLVYELTQNKNAVIWVSILFVFSAGILSAVTFLRMYIMTMFEVTFITLLFVRAKIKGCTWRFYVQITVISIMGALTHYYFLVYLFFICVIFGIYLLNSRQFKAAGFFMASMVLSGALSIAVFPGMIKHMFLKEGYRGQESINNLKLFSIREYGNRLSGFYSFINKQLFGNILTYMAVAGIIFLIWHLISKTRGGQSGSNKKRNSMTLWALAIFPCSGYFLLVSKMAVYIISRYIVPVYAVIIAAIASLTYTISGKIERGKKRHAIWSIFASIIIVNSWKMCSWEYLYSDSEALLEKVDRYSEENNLYIYDTNWKIYSSFYEISKYKSVMFLNQNNLDDINASSYKNDMSLVVSIVNSCDTEYILAQILDAFPFLDSYEEIGSYGYTTSWHLTGQDLDIHQYKIYDYRYEKLIGCDEAALDENIQMSAKNSEIKGVFQKDTGYGTLWIGNNVFDVQNGVIAEGSNIRLWGYNGTDAQIWKMKENSDGSYTILSQNDDFALTKNSDGNIYLDKLKVKDESQKWWLEIVQ